MTGDAVDPDLRGAEEGNDGHDVPRIGVAQRAEEEQQATQLVVHALFEVPVERVDDVDVLAANALGGSRLLLSPLEFALLVIREATSELLRDPLG